jgi:hypothetical protein
MRRSHLLAKLATIITCLVLTTAMAGAGIETGFEDVPDGDPFAAPITWLRLTGTTYGCNPPANTAFCPSDPVSRGQMAAFLVRSLDLPASTGSDIFADDDGTVFEPDINSIAQAGITRGCNPPDNTNYCPDRPVTRAEMAAFLTRAFGFQPAEHDYFADDDGTVFEPDINSIAQAGITRGCNPPDNTNYCPDRPVTRAEMAAFLWRAQGEPHPAPATRMVAAGDIARCGLDNDEATAALLDTLFSNTNGVVAALGDTVYPDGSPDEYRQCYEPSWGRHLFRTRPAVGNHEYHTAGASGYFDYFGEVAGDPERGWYSYGLGSWDVVVLNSNCDEIGGCDAGSAQEQWLRSVLQSSGRCSIAYMHHPRFSSGVHGDDDSLVDLWGAFEDYGVDVVLAGHDHDYERFAPLTASGDLAGPAGVQSFVVGTGGTWLRPIDGNRRRGSEIALDDVHGVLVLDLHDADYEWRFVDTSGAVLDSGRRPCS